MASTGTTSIHNASYKTAYTLYKSGELREEEEEEEEEDEKRADISGNSNSLFHPIVCALELGNLSGIFLG